MQYKLKKFQINIPEEELLADLRATAKKLGRDYLPNKLYGKYGSYDVSTFTRRFGGWNPALLKAGLKVKRLRRIPHAELMRNLKHVWDTLGRQPRYMEISAPISRYNVTIYTSRFGSWNKALEEFIRFIKLQDSGLESKAKKKRNRNEDNLTNFKNLKNLTKSISKAMRYDILKRDKFKCVLCGRTPAREPKITLQIDHIIPRSKAARPRLPICKLSAAIVITARAISHEPRIGCGINSGEGFFFGVH